MSQLAQTLSLYTGRIVVNQSGLDGDFDYDLEFTADPALMGRGPGGGLPGSPTGYTTQSDSAGNSVFAALQEQLGLKLEPQRAMVDTLVIDSAERPLEN